MTSEPNTMDSETLGAAYEVIAELLATPRSALDDRGRLCELLARSCSAPPPVRERIAAFVSGIEPARDDDPSGDCPLNLGAYLFDDPTGYHGADARNGYLLDILSVYWHFGLDPSGRQPPDYLPLMVEFAAISAAKTDARDRRMARRHFLEQHLAPGLPPLAAVLEARAPALAPLIRALEALVAADLARSVPPEASRGPAREPAVRRLPIVEER